MGFAESPRGHDGGDSRVDDQRRRACIRAVLRQGSRPFETRSHVYGFTRIHGSNFAARPLTQTTQRRLWVPELSGWHCACLHSSIIIEILSYFTSQINLVVCVFCFPAFNRGEGRTNFILLDLYDMRQNMFTLKPLICCLMLLSLLYERLYCTMLLLPVCYFSCFFSYLLGCYHVLLMNKDYIYIYIYIYRKRTVKKFCFRTIRSEILYTGILYFNANYKNKVFFVMWAL